MSAVLKPANEAHADTRYNLYTIIHKALRAFMTDTLLKLGRMDVTDDQERGDAIEQLRALLAMCDSHLRHENDYVHTALEMARRGAAAATARDHAEHEMAIAQLTQDVARFESAPTSKRPALALHLYRGLSGFIAENFEHMIVEETDNHLALITAYDEGEVLEIEHRIVSSLGPDESFTSMRWMIPHINSSERAFLLGGMKQHAPPEAFQGVWGLARQLLSTRDFEKLERSLA